MEDEARPTKRIKIDPNDANVPREETSYKTSQAATNDHTTRSMDVNEAQSHASVPSKNSLKAQKHLHKTQKGVENKNRKNALRTFSQPSVLCVGDKGIFVTSDKGCEKKALLELQGILQDYLELRGIDASGAPMHQEDPQVTNPESEAASFRADAPGGIEADIASELAELKSAGQTDVNAPGVQSSKPMQLITLDIPCVSFLRLPTKSTVDPVELVHRLCLEAFDPNTPQRSRFVKRLTPISSLAKTLRQGLETVSEAVLPHHFGPDGNGDIKSVKFAIRPTVRENEQLDRDLIIKPVADRIQELGKAAHKVDLKQYEKGVIVEVYRGWIGMCVVDNIYAQGQQPGYEQLRRFNLSEIYAKR